MIRNITHFGQVDRRTAEWVRQISSHVACFQQRRKLMTIHYSLFWLSKLIPKSHLGGWYEIDGQRHEIDRLGLLLPHNILHRSIGDLTTICSKGTTF